jgi:hypothetical protein
VLEDAEDRHRSVIAGAGVAVGLVMMRARHARLSTRGHDGGRSHSEVQKAAEAEQIVWKIAKDSRIRKELHGVKICEVVSGVRMGKGSGE